MGTFRGQLLEFKRGRVPMRFLNQMNDSRTYRSIQQPLEHREYFQAYDPAYSPVINISSRDKSSIEYFQTDPGTGFLIPKPNESLSKQISMQTSEVDEFKIIDHEKNERLWTPKHTLVPKKNVINKQDFFRTINSPKIKIG